MTLPGQPIMTHLPITIPDDSMSTTKGALVLFSGGQDSATCLAWALERYPRVETIGFDYRQRHAVELAVRLPLLEQMRALSPAWAEKLGEDHLVDLGLLSAISDTALTRDVEIRMQDDGLPNTFVPGRNLLFMTVAATLAYRRGLDVLVGGMCETDFSGYPDCRDDTMKALQVTLNLGMGTRLKLETPADVAGQGRHLAPGAGLGRASPGRTGPHRHPYLLPGRARHAA